MTTDDSTNVVASYIAGNDDRDRSLSPDHDARGRLHHRRLPKAALRQRLHVERVGDQPRSLVRSNDQDLECIDLHKRRQNIFEHGPCQARS